MDSTGPWIYRNGETTAGLYLDLFYSTDKKSVSNSGIKPRTSVQPAEISSPYIKNWASIQCRIYPNFTPLLETNCKNSHFLKISLIPSLSFQAQDTATLQDCRVFKPLTLRNVSFLDFFSFQVQIWSRDLTSTRSFRAPDREKLKLFHTSGCVCIHKFRSHVSTH